MYLLDADPCGTGNDGEPLVTNPRNISPYKINVPEISDQIFWLMQENFEKAEGTRDRDNTYFGYSYGIDPYICKWRFNGVDFWGAKSDAFVTWFRNGKKIIQR